MTQFRVFDVCLGPGAKRGDTRPTHELNHETVRLWNVLEPKISSKIKKNINDI